MKKTIFVLGAGNGHLSRHWQNVCLVPFASYFPMLGLFQGANDALYATFVATSALAVRVIFTYALQGIPAIGHRMVWWNTLFGWGIGFIITWIHFFSGKWKKKSLLSYEKCISKK